MQNSNNDLENVEVVAAAEDSHKSLQNNLMYQEERHRNSDKERQR